MMWQRVPSEELQCRSYKHREQSKRIIDTRPLLVVELTTKRQGSSGYLLLYGLDGAPSYIKMKHARGCTTAGETIAVELLPTGIVRVMDGPLKAK